MIIISKSLGGKQWPGAFHRFLCCTWMVKYYLKANCDKLKMYAVTPKETTTNRQQNVYFVNRKGNKIK